MPEDITTELVWTGTDDTEVFVDAAYNDEYWPRESDTDRPHMVLAERAEWLLEHEGWEVPQGVSEEEFRQSLPAQDDDVDVTAQSDADTGADADARATESQKSGSGGNMITVGTSSGGEEVVQGDTAGTTVQSESSDEVEQRDESPDLTIEETVEEVTDGDGSFDADRFVDETDWREVRSAINEGEVDDHLDAIEAAEEGRDTPREASVLSTIDARRRELGIGAENESDAGSEDSGSAEDEDDGDGTGSALGDEDVDVEVDEAEVEVEAEAEGEGESVE